MNSLLVAASGVLLLALGYKVYGRILEKLWNINPKKKTPAQTRPDNVDYIPAKHWTILFGHHFASIAGAGPIIGPVIACAIWGWLPALIWIVVGSVLIGGVHDFSSLMVSVRNQGKSVADVTESVLNYRIKMILASFLWLLLVLVIAVFAAVTAKTLVSEPKIVIPTFGLVLVAVFTGILMYRWKVNQLISTIIGIGLLSGLFFLGSRIPVSFNVEHPVKIWMFILFVYAFFASVIPVNILLQPRDYLSSFILFFGLFFGYLGLVFSHPQMHTPPLISFQSSSSGPLWPMLCVIIACGAISGFHSLVAGGTTSKQIANEKDAKRIGYGGMILEGVLAILAMICVCAGLYWKGEGALNYPTLLKSGNWIETFAKGYGQIAKPILGASNGSLIAMIMINAFVMTTLDSATRIGRYIGEELFGEGLKIKLMKNRYLSTAIIIVMAFYLAMGSWQSVWPVFGAANQLVAALVLMVITVYLFSLKKSIKYTAIGAAFMFLTAVAALCYKTKSFLSSKEYLLGSISIILSALAIFMLVESVKVIKRPKSKGNSL